MLACRKLLFINKGMMLETQIDIADRPMVKMLSVILMIGQGILALSAFICILAAILFCLPESVSLSMKAEFSDKLDTSLVLGELLSGAIVSLGWFFVLYCLRKVASALIHGDPFSPESISRIRLILLLVTATEIIRIAKVFFLGASDVPSDVAVLDIRAGTLFLIFIIAVISEAFRHGAALRAEQELTI
jgi:hypothetical protein